MPTCASQSVSASDEASCKPAFGITDEHLRKPAALLSALLERMRHNPDIQTPEAAARAALAVSEELSKHFRKIIGDNISHDLSGTDGTALTSSSDSEANTQSKNRPNAKTRARFRRKLLRQQQQQQIYQEGPDPWNYAQEGWHQPVVAPLPDLMEQQEQHFRESLWSGGWIMVPVLPTCSPTEPSTEHSAGQLLGQAACSVQSSSRHARPNTVRAAMVRDEAQFRHAMWRGGWQMVPIADALPENRSDSIDVRSATTQFQLRVNRCLKVHRWRRMQRVWTDWMREHAALEGDSAPTNGKARSH